MLPEHPLPVVRVGLLLKAEGRGHIVTAGHAGALLHEHLPEGHPTLAVVDAKLALVGELPLAEEGLALGDDASRARCRPSGAQRSGERRAGADEVLLVATCCSFRSSGLAFLSTRQSVRMRGSAATTPGAVSVSVTCRTSFVHSFGCGIASSERSNPLDKAVSATTTSWKFIESQDLHRPSRPIPPARSRHGLRGIRLQTSGPAPFSFLCRPHFPFRNTHELLMVRPGHATHQE